MVCLHPSSGGIVRTLVLFLLTSITLASVGRAQIAVSRIELVNETVKVEGQSAIAGLALRCHVVVAALDSSISFVPSIGYWRDSDRYPEFGIQHVAQRDWTFGLDARYAFAMKFPVQPYFGGGVDLHAIAAEFQRTGETEATSDATRLGLHVLFGIDLPAAARIQSSFELAYHAVSDLGQFKMNWVIGVRL